MTQTENFYHKKKKFGFGKINQGQISNDKVQGKNKEIIHLKDDALVIY